MKTESASSIPTCLHNWKISKNIHEQIGKKLKSKFNFRKLETVHAKLRRQSAIFFKTKNCVLRSVLKRYYESNYKSILKYFTPIYGCVSYKAAHLYIFVFRRINRISFLNEKSRDFYSFLRQ